MRKFCSENDIMALHEKKYLMACWLLLPLMSFELLYLSLLWEWEKSLIDEVQSWKLVKDDMQAIVSISGWGREWND